MVTRIIISAIFVSIGVLPLRADKTDGGEEDQGKLKSGLRLTTIGDWKGDELFVKNRKERKMNGMKKVEILNMGLSPVMKYTPNSTIKFFRKTGDEENPYELAVEVVVPSGVLQPLVLFALNSKKEILYRVFDIDPRNFPYGSCKVVNYSSKKLLVLMNTDGHALSPDAQHLFMPMKGKQARARLQLVDLAKNKPVFSSMMIRRAQKRLIMFVIDDPDKPGKGRVKAKVLVDFKQPPKKADD